MNKPLTRPLPSPLDLPAHGLTVLVADDSRAQRMVLAMSLNRWGYRVTEASSGSPWIRSHWYR